MRRLRRSRVLALFGASGLAAIGLPIVAMAGPGAQAPDLRADPVEDIEGPSVYFDTEAGLGNGALLVRFDGFVTNVGQGPVEISGNPQVPGSVRQLARTADNQPPTVHVATPEVKFEGADSHNHWHLMRAMRYSLWNLQKTARVAPGQKVGFCLYDIEQASGAPKLDPKTYTVDVTLFCQSVDYGGGGPAATTLRMGTSPGWRDVYDKSLAYQWIDVSNTSPGTYLVGAESDPDNVVWEGGGAAETNATAFAPSQVTVPGWVAKPVALTQTGAAQAVPLASQKFGTQSDGNLRYRIVSAPAGGSLNVPVNGTFSSAQQLVYTPTPGSTASDSFTYAAFSASSSFPTSPPVATVTITGATPSITLSGAPASLVAGTSAQLTASLANIGGGVNWSATSGTVSPTGLYSAPGTPPAGGVAIVRASSAANPGVAAEVAIAISKAPATTARPNPSGPLSAGNKLLSPLRITHLGSRVVVGKVVTGRKAGRVTVTATFGRKVLGRCVAPRVGARKAVTCKVTLKRNYPLTKVRVTATFAAKGGPAAVRRAFVVR